MTSGDPETEGRPAKRAPFRLIITSWRTLRLAWQASRRQLLLLIVLTIAGAVVPPAVVLITGKLVNIIAQAAGQDGIALSKVMPWAVALGALTVLQRVSHNVVGSRQRVFGYEVERHVEMLFLRKASQSDLARFDDPSWHDRVQRVSRDIQTRPDMLAWSVIGGLGSVITLGGMMGVLLSLHPVLLLLAVVSVLSPLPFQRRVNRRFFNFFLNVSTKERERQYYRQYLSETPSAKDLRAFVLEQHLLDRHKRLTDDWMSSIKRIFGSFDRVSAFSGLVGGLAVVAAYVFVAYRTAGGNLNPGDVAALIGAFAGFTAEVGLLASTFTMIDQNAPFLADFFEFLSIEPTVRVAKEPRPLPERLEGGIEFDDVVFRYPGQSVDALHNLGLRIAPGEMLALVGDNGAGKTTMVKLLLRFYDPQGGSIRIGGVDLRETDPTELRERIGVLFQDYTHILLTARDGVGFGRIGREPTDEAVWPALRSARADGIVKDLPNGLDSVVGRMFEGGKDLSGGEWQRLALARLIFRQADVWILDEPTSSLDPEAEAQVFSELKRQLAGRIGIVISHRFSTVRIADRIAVVQDGRITELGTHEELVALKGRYAELFELQASAYR